MNYKIVTYLDPRIYDSAIDNARETTNHIFTRQDLKLFWDGWHAELFEKMGAHEIELNGVRGCYFCIWVDAAEAVSVELDGKVSAMRQMPESYGKIWEAFIPGAHAGQDYINLINKNGQEFRVTDPFAFKVDPDNSWAAQITGNSTFVWHDAKWIETGRKEVEADGKPCSLLEVFLQSLKMDSDGRQLTGEQLAEKILKEIEEKEYTHVEIMPVTEYLNDQSWGYQVDWFFAITHRLGIDNVQYIVDQLHQKGIPVYLDMVLTHFDKHLQSLVNLGYQGEACDFGTYLFNHGKNEVRSFLLSAANYYRKALHIDGARLDAVSEIINFFKKENGAVKNWENPGGIEFMRRVTQYYKNYGGNLPVIAEESSGYADVRNQNYNNPKALGCSDQWALWYLFATLKEIIRDDDTTKWGDRLIDTIYGNIGRVLVYSHDENAPDHYCGDANHLGSLYAAVLPHGGNSPEDHIVRARRLAVIFGMQFMLPGHKLTFMTSGRKAAWWYNQPFSFDDTSDPWNQEIGKYLHALNHAYVTEPALHKYDRQPDRGLQLVNFDRYNMVLTFIRRADDPKDNIFVVINLGRNRHEQQNFKQFGIDGYQAGITDGGDWEPVFDSDDPQYFSINDGINPNGKVTASNEGKHDQPYSIKFNTRPGSVVAFKRVIG
ncbi:MAG: alpha amylase C-terminal domain-containing protein [Candidatus Margulisiibacteriota bacterium]